MSSAIDGSGLSQYEPSHEGVVRVEDELAGAAAVGHAGDLGITAGWPSSVNEATALQVKLEPTIESCTSTCPGPRSPRAVRTATREAEPEPHGDLSTSPSAKMVTLR